MGVETGRKVWISGQILPEASSINQRVRSLAGSDAVQQPQLGQADPADYAIDIQRRSRAARVGAPERLAEFSEAEVAPGGPEKPD
jgi:hypothetical protein